jgi:hypothetical protein
MVKIKSAWKCCWDSHISTLITDYEDLWHIHQAFRVLTYCVSISQQITNASYGVNQFRKTLETVYEAQRKVNLKAVETKHFCRSVRLKTRFAQLILMKVPSVKFKKLSMLYLRIPFHRLIHRHDLHITRSISQFAKNAINWIISRWKD